MTRKALEKNMQSIVKHVTSYDELVDKIFGFDVTLTKLALNWTVALEKDDIIIYNMKSDKLTTVSDVSNRIHELRNRNDDLFA